MTYEAYINPIRKRERSLYIRHYSHHIMWLCLTLLLIIGAAVADHNYAWETGNEYHFNVESRTLTVLDNLADQYSGILMRGGLTIHAKSSDTLQATVSNTQYASASKLLVSDVWGEIADLEFQKLSLSNKPFEIKHKNSVIQDVLVDQDVPTWEVNLLKGIVGQLQIDIEGENAISRSTVPNDNQPSGTFKVMEDSVGGKCEVTYIIAVDGIDTSVPLPHLGKDGRHIAITKMKNYTRCQQRMAYHSGISGFSSKMNWKPGSADGFLGRESIANIIISGNTKRFTIQSSVIKNQIFMNSKIDASYSGTVYNSVNLTLDRMNLISNPMPTSNNLASTGNLVYTYNNPFSSQRKPRRPSVNRSPLPTRPTENRSSNNSSDESRSDDDSSNISDLNINSEERDYLQPKPKLDEAPESPLLPYFIGYKGESILKSEENYNAAAKHLITQTASEIESFNIYLLVVQAPIPETLEQFAILIRMIRTMNSVQIAELESMLFESSGQTSSLSEEPPINNAEKAKGIHQTLWDILCHAVASAGTGPALITIKNWIKNGKLEGKQAALVISKIPKTALAPTAEYVAAFFEMITDEQVTKQRFLNTTAPLSFAELARYAQNNKSSVYYPVYSFGRMVSKRDNALFEIYIPYMATQLRKAMETGDSVKIQTYIMALGNFGHPKILSIFEPYLEGTLSASKFQRLMMVRSLEKLSENFPRVARFVAYKIYANVNEAYELRCTAVYIVTKTNPPLTMLQRMAEFTNEDQDPHVNSAIKTRLEAIANLKEPEWKEQAERARIAKKLLNPDIDVESQKYSQSILKETKAAFLNIAQIMSLQTISSDDTDTIKSATMNLYQSYGGFSLPGSTISYSISSIRHLLDMWDQMPWMAENAARKKFIIEETINQLGITPEDAEQFEGNVFVDNLFASEFLPFDNHTIEEVINVLKTHIASLSETPTKILESRDTNCLNHYDMTLGLPTETGLPFIYTLTIPKFTKIGSRGSYKMTNSETERIMELIGAGIIFASEKIQSRIGFVTPFEHKHYIAGIDTNTIFFIPGSLSVKSSGAKKYEFKINSYQHPRTSSGTMTIHHSVVPYIAKHDILDFQPVLSVNSSHVVHVQEPHKASVALNNMIISAQSDYIDSDMSKKMGLEALTSIGTVFYIKNRGAHYRRFDVMMHFEEQVNVTFDNFVTLDSKGSEVTIPAVIDKQPDSEERKQQFLQEISKDINSATGFYLDISILSSGITQIVTLALAGSNVDHKAQGLLYWNAQSPGGEVLSEFCTIGHVQSSRDIPLNFEQAVHKIPNHEFKAEMRIGGCETGNKIRLEGNLTRTDDVVQMALRSEAAEKCQQEMKRGDIWLPSCQKASKLIKITDLLTLSMYTDSEQLLSVANGLINKAIYMGMKISDSRSAPNTIDMKIKLLLDEDDAAISMSNSETNFTFNIRDLFEVESNFTLIDYLEEDSEEHACALDKTRAVTFDDKVYPLTLGNCWHVMMTTYPKRDPNNPEQTLTIPKDMRVLIMAREMNDGSKQIRMILDDEEIHLQKSGNKLQAMVNEQVVNFSRHVSYRENDVEIYELADMIIAVSSDEYEIYAVYDGDSILLQASSEYYKAIRGLCGNYDLQPSNDFITPKNCILTKPEEFVATYALTQENCQGPALQNKPKAEQSTCTPLSHSPTDVISDREAGRSPTRYRG